MLFRLEAIIHTSQTIYRLIYETTFQSSFNLTHERVLVRFSVNINSQLKIMYLKFLPNKKTKHTWALLNVEQTKTLSYCRTTSDNHYPYLNSQKYLGEKRLKRINEWCPSIKEKLNMLMRKQDFRFTLCWKIVNQGPVKKHQLLSRSNLSLVRCHLTCRVKLKLTLTRW